MLLKKNRKKIELTFILLQFTWGIIQNIIGLGIFLINRKEQHFYYKGAVVTFWNKREMSLGIGLFIFISKDYLEAGQNDEEAEKECNRIELDRIKVHEYGHTVQSALLGPLFLPVIGLPSLLWANLTVCGQYRQKRGQSYYSFYTERWANQIGEWATGEKAM